MGSRTASARKEPPRRADLACGVRRLLLLSLEPPSRSLAARAPAGGAVRDASGSGRSAGSSSRHPCSGGMSYRRANPAKQGFPRLASAYDLTRSVTVTFTPGKIGWTNPESASPRATSSTSAGAPARSSACSSDHALPFCTSAINRLPRGLIPGTSSDHIPTGRSSGDRTSPA
jgi:hypothetical protein